MATQWTFDPRPDEMALRDWVRPRLDAPTVHAMAALDHGMRVDEHRRGIEELLAVRHLPAELPWTPREVLELASHGLDHGHAARLFACLVLVRADGTLVPAGALAKLVESALELGPEATGAAVRYLAWCRLREPGAWRDDAEARPFLALGLLILYASGSADPAVVAELTREVGAADRASLRKAAGGEGWRIWRALVDRRSSIALPPGLFTTPGR